MYKSIVKSSNVYYYSLANEMAWTPCTTSLKPLGFRQITASTSTVKARRAAQPGLSAGLQAPRNRKMVSRRDHFAGHWSYNTFTMLLLCATAVLANNGIKHTPRLVIGTQDTVTRVLHPLQPPGAGRFRYSAANVAVAALWRHPRRHVGQGVFGCG
jgi:penicillin-binding protein 2